jgi:hypothetical protein
MTLNDDDSREIIINLLEGAGWTPKQIRNISKKNLVRVVEAINNELTTIHEESTPIFEAAKARQAMIQKMYIGGIAKLQEQYGDELPTDQVLLWFSICDKEQKKAFAELGAVLNDRLK